MEKNKGGKRVETVCRKKKYMTYTGNRKNDSEREKKRKKKEKKD